MFHVFAALIGLYVIGRFVPPLPVGTLWKWLIAFVILLVSQYHLVNRLFLGGMASPEVPFPVLAFGGWLFGAFILLAGFLLIRDLVSLFLWTAHKTGLIPVSIVFGYRWMLGLGMVALLLSAVGVWQAVRIPDVRRIDITLEKLPAELDGLKLVQLTDLHASRLSGPLDPCGREQDECPEPRPDRHYWATWSMAVPSTAHPTSLRWPI